jgi:hypothetical protein
MIKRSVLTQNNLKYEGDFSPSEDYALWCNLIGKTEFHNIPEILFKYRDHSENTTNKAISNIIKSGDKVLQLVRKKYPDIWDSLDKNSTTFYRIKLFGFIPFLTIKKRQIEVKYLLFNFILLFSSKKNLKHKNMG